MMRSVLRLVVAAGVLAVAIGPTPNHVPSRSAVPVPPPAADDISRVPAELVPAVIDAVQRGADASYRPVARGTTRPMIASNRAHGLEATFGSGRVDVAVDGDRAGAQALALSASAVAIDGVVRSLHGERRAVRTDRVTYAHAPSADVRLEEWFRNGPLGLQHGFDVAALPAGARDLRLTIDVGEAWRTSSTDGDANGAVTLSRADGQGERYAYSYLRAWDASGRFLPARLTAGAHDIDIAVDVRGAALPITIDPLLQQAILTPGIATPGGGVTVAVRGNRALIGAPFTTVGTNAQQGVVYYYRRNTASGVWQLLATISDPNGAANDWFGYSVAIGMYDQAAIGAPLADPGGVSNGGKVFRLNLYDTGPSSVIYEVNSPRNTDDLFGFSVAMEGDTLVAAAEQDTASAVGQGTVEVWGYSASDNESFIRKATLTAPSAASLDHFGYSVAISGDTVVVGAPDVDLASPARANVGAAYVYTYDGPSDSYVFQARLDRPGTAVACENFGGSVAISGERIVVGSGISSSTCSPGGPNVSQVHEFTRSGTAWCWATSFTPSDCTTGQVCQGTRVALAASLLTVGLQFEIVNGVQTGAVKAYRRTTAGWSAAQRLPAPGLVANSRFGIWVAAGSNYALAGVLGAPGQTGFAPIFGPSPGDLLPAIGDGVQGDFGSGSGWRHRLNLPYGVSLGAGGQILVADTYNHRLKAYDPILDSISLRAGNGIQGAAGDGGFAGGAQLNYPTDVAVDASGRVYIADWGNAKIRRIDASGIISTVAGTGGAGFSGDGGPATAAQLNGPYGVSLDAAGNLYIADYLNNRVRRVDAVTNVITTIAGTGTAGYNGDGILATTAQLNSPSDVEVTPNGAIYIADTNNSRIRRIDPATNQIATVLGTGSSGYNGDGPGTVAQIASVARMAVDSANNLYVADQGNHRVRRVVAGSGNVETIAGTGLFGTDGEGGPAGSAQLQSPFAVAVAPAGVFIAETALSRIRRIEPAGFALTYTSAGTGLGSVSIDPPGLVCASSCTNNFGSGTTVTLVAAAAATSTFAGWSGACTGTGVCSVAMTQARSVTATFTGNPQLLTVNRSGTGTGTVTSAPAGISCGADCTETYAYNTSVTLTAAAGVNSAFSGWTGDCAGTGACVVAMNQARAVTAQFTPTGAPPTITSRSPARGSTRGGTVVVLTGQNFVAGTTVRVGALTVPVLLSGTTQLSFVTPAVSTPGVQTITVQTASGQATTPFDFAAPTFATHEGWRRPAFAIDRYVAFETALPLLPEDTNGVADVYVYDDVTDTVRRVSVSTIGREAIGGESTHAVISATGRFVAFESLADNLVHSDTNGLSDVFLHDRDADENGVFDELGGISTIRISVTSAGVQAIGGGSSAASISGNGRFVAFQSSATNLVAGDANAVTDVFVHDRLLGTTVRASIATDGTTATAGDSVRPAISQNGRFVAFDSAAVLTAGDTNAARDVFVHDRDVDGDGVMDEPGAVATRRISVASNGTQAVASDSVDPSITGDGRYVVFASWATNLVAGDTNHVSDVFLQDRDVDGDGLFDEPGQIATRRVTVGAGGAEFTVASGTPRISANGKLLVFLVATSTSAPVFRGAVTAADVASDPGKSSPWTQPDPTNPNPTPPGKSTPQPPDIPPGDPVPDPDTGDVSTSPDGDEWGGTDTTNGPTVVIVEEPDEDEPTPAIAVVSPDHASSSGGALVTIEGRDLAGTLYWNDVPLATQSRTPTKWTAVAPARGAGPATATLYVQVADRRSNTASFSYVTQSTPRWTSHDPLSWPVTGNRTMTIAGSGFDAPTVRLGPYRVIPSAWTAAQITLTVPEALVAGPVPVVVVNADGAEAVSGVPFTYEPGAGSVAVQVVQPQAVSFAGGDAVTILGSGFTPGTTVAFGGRPATDVQVLSSRALLVETPSASPGELAVVVSVPGQAAVTGPSIMFAPAPDVSNTCTGTDADGDGMDDAWETQFGLVAGDPSDGSGDPDNDGLTNQQECLANTHPRGLYTRYLAEGATGSFFDTKIALANPNSTAARVLLRFQSDTGATYGRFLLLPPMSRRTVRPASIDGLGAVGGVSTVVESDVEIVVDRTMEWGLGPSTGVYGSHAETSLAAPRTTWYLAEGATHGDFDLFYLLQNPGTTDAVVRVRFLRPGGQPPIERDYTVPAQRRYTLLVDRIPGLEATDVSAVFHSLNDVPIIVERAMYRTGAGMRAFEAGHDSAAVEAPSTHWFLAEGATAPLFDTFVLLANPNDAAASVSITYLLSGGKTVARTYQVAGNSRSTLHVSDEAPELASASVSMIVAVTNGVPIIVERSMWWPSQIAVATLPAFGAFWGEAHNSPGATATGTKWAVADGETGVAPKSTATYYLIANTSSYAADVTVTLLSETDGQPLTRHFAVAANSRFTVGVGADFPETTQDGNRTYGAIIESLPVGGQAPAQIVVERAMYSNSTNAVWAAGSNLLGTRLR